MRSVTEATHAFEAVFRGARRALINPLFVALLSALFVAGARTEDAAAPVQAQATGFTDQGYGRLLLTFSEETKADVQLSNGILVVSFRRPVEVAVDRLKDRLAGYVQAARRDPDSGAIRLSLVRQVSVNVMEAGEKLFIDLLPEDWAGLPPGLPQEVVDELAKRAREAEKRERMNQALPRKAWAPVKLRYAAAPNFARFAFEMPEPIATATAREGQELRITFAAPVKVDFGEAKVKLPASVAGLEAQYESDETIVKLVLAPEAGVRTFRDDTAFTVDVTPPPPGAKPQAVEGKVDEDDPAAGKAAAEPNTDPAKNELAAVEVAAPKATPEKDANSRAPLLETVPAAKEAAPAIPVAASSSEPVLATLSRQAGTTAIVFAFGEPVAGALFRRGETIYLVFDTARPIHTGELANAAPRFLREIEQIELPQGRLIKLKLDKHRLTSLESDGSAWIVNIGDTVGAPSRPLPVRRVYTAESRPGLFVPLAAPSRVHTIDDPDNSDGLVVVTAEPPARGLARAQDFVDFRALATTHGLVLAPKADDLMIELAAEGVTITRPAGLVVSEMDTALPPLPEAKKHIARALTPLDPEIWKAERDSPFYDREMELSRAVAETPLARRSEQRLALARFYLAHDFPANAAGTLEAAVTEETQSGDDAGFALLHALAELELARPDDALRDLAKPSLAAVAEAALLRANALTQTARFTEAREQFAAGQTGLIALPIELQRAALIEALRAAIEVSDFAEASRIRNEFETIGVSKDQEVALAMLSARLAQGIGKSDQATSEFASVALGDDGPASAEARLRLIEMRYTRGDLDRAKAIEALEVLSYAWRGNTTELETLRFLARLYVREARYREAFRQLDAALLSHPGSEITRAFQTEMATVFEDLFLSDKGASVEPIDALAIYYDFSKLTPIGRRGDELIRRLADRLVAVDLLDQAAELLDHQVEFRLAGAAKAQVATKLAMIHLMNRKPAEAIRVLAGSRSRELPQDLREQRLLLEARAIAETGRHDAALEMIENLTGAEADRMRADVLWSAKRWREAGEAIEKFLGDRWKKEPALDEIERGDVLRAGIAFALGNETIGLSRLRDRFAAKMDGPERKAFDIVASGEWRNPKSVGEVARTLSAADSLDLFIKLYRARFPDKPLPPDTAPTADIAPRISTR
jgi:hypothetical protein